MSVHERAAGGDWHAFSTLAATHYQRSQEGMEPPEIALARAVEYGRMAAIRGERREMITLL